MQATTMIALSLSKSFSSSFFSITTYFFIRPSVLSPSFLNTSPTLHFPFFYPHSTRQCRQAIDYFCRSDPQKNDKVTFEQYIRYEFLLKLSFWYSLIHSSIFSLQFYSVIYIFWSVDNYSFTYFFSSFALRIYKISIMLHTLY